MHPRPPEPAKPALVPSPSFGDSLGWFSCESDQSHAESTGWIPRRQIRLPIDDLGFRQATTAVERLRTYHGTVWQSDRHAERFAGSLTCLGMKPWCHEKWNQILDELVQRNRSQIEAADVGITLIATPGCGSLMIPTEIAMIQPIDHEQSLQRQTNGQPIVTTDVVQPPAESWSRQAKLRCRVHYYLADQKARLVAKDASGLLVDTDGTITETSIANIACVIDGEIHSPTQSQVLRGVSQSVIEDLAYQCNLAWHHRPIHPSELRSADEVWLMGTDSGIWFSHRVDAVTIGEGNPGPIYQKLKTCFLNRVGR